MAKRARLTGEVVDGKYQLDKRLGRGGMGAVYLATHLGTKRPVALKVIAPQFMANEEFVERFRREAEAAGRLRHPNVVNVTDFGFARVGADDLAYLVMEYLDGATLGDTLKQRNRLPLEMVVDIVEQVCLAIDDAHKQGVIHRDLKPDNIWLEPDRRGGYNVKVLDFGLAKLRDTAASDSALGAQPRELSRVLTRTMSEGPAETLGVKQATAHKMADTKEGEAATRIQSFAESEEQQTALFDHQTERGSTDLETADLESTDLETADLEASTWIQSVADEDRTDSETGNDAGSEVSSEVSASASGRQSSTGPFDLSSASSSNLTRMGAVMGTPLYMSPEQCRGEALDSSSDIYSLGVVVYQMLAGETPFDGDMSELILKHTEEAPPPLSDRASDTPEAVEAVVMSALAKKPADRPSSARAFSDAFRATAEDNAAILRQAKQLYYGHIAHFFSAGLIAYFPFILLAILISVALSLAEVDPLGLFSLAFWPLLALIIVFANHVKAAAFARVILLLRASPDGRAPVRHIFSDLIGKARPLLSTALQSMLATVSGLVKMIVPGFRASINHALFPSIVIVEGREGGAALARSEQLVKPLYQVAAALDMRNLGIALAALLALPFFGMLGIVVSGGPPEMWLYAVLRLRYLNIAYTWFMLLIVHSVYGTIPLVLLYFRARQANGEAFEQSAGQEPLTAEKRKRQGAFGKSTKVWIAAPFIMLAAILLPPLLMGRPAIVEAARTGRSNEVKRLLEAGANANAKTTPDITALMFAAGEGHSEIVRALLEAGADPKVRAGDGGTALMQAAEQGRAQVMKMLLDAGADPNAANNIGQTPLMVASGKGRVEAITVLLAAGADVNLKDNKGKSALSYAEEEGYDEVAESLRGR